MYACFVFVCVCVCVLNRSPLDGGTTASRFARFTPTDILSWVVNYIPDFRNHFEHNTELHGYWLMEAIEQDFATHLQMDTR